MDHFGCVVRSSKVHGGLRKVTTLVAAQAGEKGVTSRSESDAGNMKRPHSLRTLVGFAYGFSRSGS